jgi:hypothetical protein
MAMADYREEDISSEESDDEEKIITKRAKGKVYELPCVSFKNPDTAEKAMKGNFLGADWKYVSRKLDVVWYECKCTCKKRLKLQLLTIDGHCQASVEVDFFQSNHSLPASNLITIGLKQDVKEKVLTYSKLGAKPIAIMEQLRQEGRY